MNKEREDLLVAMADALLVVLDNQRHKPSLDRHNEIRSQLGKALHALRIRRGHR